MIRAVAADGGGLLESLREVASRYPVESGRLIREGISDIALGPDAVP